MATVVGWLVVIPSFPKPVDQLTIKLLIPADADQRKTRSKSRGGGPYTGAALDYGNH